MWGDGPHRPRQEPLELATRGLLWVNRDFRGGSCIVDWITNCMVRFSVILGLVLTSVALVGSPAYLTHSYQERAVAAVIMGEAWGQGKTGMVAVGEVICERSMRLGRTPYRVVTVGRKGVHAFSCLNGTTMDALIRKFSSKREYRVALEVARLVCREPERLPGVTRGATHFCLANQTPRWAEGERPVVVIGAHAFYRLAWL